MTDYNKRKLPGSSTIYFCCGTPISELNSAQAYQKVIFCASNSIPFPVRFINAYSISLIRSNQRYESIVKGIGMNLADSSALVAISKAKYINRRGLIQQTRGVDFLRYSLGEGVSKVKHSFIGGDSETLIKLEGVLRSEYASAEFGSFVELPFTNDINFLVETIKDHFHPEENEIIWVSLGTPKQDLVASELAIYWGKPVISVGAAFNFLAGTVKEAPAFLVNLHLEWLFRLVAEPRRLWKRYLFGNTKFMVAAILSGKNDLQLTKMERQKN